MIESTTGAPHAALAVVSGRRLAEVLQSADEPRLVDGWPYRHLELDGCPFRDLARAFPQVVCSVHQGLLWQVLHRSGIPSAAQAGLRQFVEPELCIADVPIPSGRQEQRCPEPVC